jgi:hypothetical protein
MPGKFHDVAGCRRQAGTVTSITGQLTLRRAREQALQSALQCARAAALPETKPEVAVALCKAAGKYAGRVRELEAMGARP